MSGNTLYIHKVQVTLSTVNMDQMNDKDAMKKLNKSDLSTKDTVLTPFY